MRHGEHRRTDPRGAKAGGHDPGDAGQGGERVPADHLPLGGGPRHAGCGDAAEAVGAAGGQLLDADGDKRAAGGDAARPATGRACTQAEAAPAAEAATASVSAKLRRHWVALAAVLLCAALVAGFFGFRAPRPRVYVANNGKSYTVEQFQQAAPRQEGRAWLSVEKIVRTQSGAEKGVNMYDLIFHEMNGVCATIDRLEMCSFMECVI